MIHVRISTTILSEITDISAEKLKTIYGENSIELSKLPVDQQEEYIENYLYHDRIIDIDLLPLFSRTERTDLNCLQPFFQEVQMLRRAALVSGEHKTEKLRLIAKEYDISLPTLMRKRRFFMRNPKLKRLIEPLELSYIHCDNLKTCCSLACDYYFYRRASNSKASDNKILRELTKLIGFSCSKCPYNAEWQKIHPKAEHSFTCTRQTSTMIIPETRYPLNRLRHMISRQDIDLAQKGKNFWEGNYNYTPERKKPTTVNAVWFSDHTQLDIMVKVGKKADGSPIIRRVWLTGIMDAATNALVGYALSIQPNSSTIAEAFSRAVVYTADSPFIGLPEVFYIDNGKDYRSRLMEGCSTEKLCLNKEFAESGILEWLRVEVIHTLPYRGCSKTIERIWRTIEENWISDLPGYCGNSPKDRPAKLKNELKSGKIYTFQQFADYFADVIWKEYNNFKSTPKCKSPMELYHSLERSDTLIPTWRTMCVLKHQKQKRYVQRSGIKFENRWYWHPKLAEFIGETVTIYTFDAPFHTSIAVAWNNRFIAEAHPVHSLDLIEEDKYKVINHLAEQKRHRRKVSERLEEVRQIVLQTDLLEKGVGIPAVEEYVYTQAIDRENDEANGVDDARIPNELKELALKYTNERSVAAPSPMDELLMQIGKEVIHK